MKKALIVALPIVLVLGGCGAPAISQPAPMQTPAVPPTETSAAPTATLEPSPTPDPMLFRDDFEGSLGEGWHWLRENKKYWSLASNPGWLEIMAGPGTVGAGRGAISNLLLRQAPEGNFELETMLSFRPVGNVQIGGLLIYESDGHYVQFGRAFCGGGRCVGDGFYFDVVKGGKFTGENFATKGPETDTIYLRLTREGATLTGLVSEDGKEWTTIGAHNDQMKPLFVGLVAGQASGSVPKPAQFDYFLMNALP